jgi:transcriptional regulator with XRE-family HTH domain
MAPRIGFQKPRARRRTFIKQWRIFRDLSQEALGERLGTSGGSISRIENGQQPYTQDTLEALAEALMTDPASLLMRNPTDEDAIWSVWEHAKEGDRRKIVDIAKTIVGKTGTGN